MTLWRRRALGQLRRAANVWLARIFGEPDVLGGGNDPVPEMVLFIWALCVVVLGGIGLACVSLGWAWLAVALCFVAGVHMGALSAVVAIRGRA